MTIRARSARPSVIATVLAYVISVGGGLWIALAVASLNSDTSPATLASAASNATAGLAHLGVWALGLFVVPGFLSLAIRDGTPAGRVWCALSAALVWGLWAVALVAIMAVVSGELSVSIPGGAFGLAGIAAAAGCAFGWFTSRDIGAR